MYPAVLLAALISFAPPSSEQLVSPQNDATLTWSQIDRSEDMMVSVPVKVNGINHVAKIFPNSVTSHISSELVPGTPINSVVYIDLDTPTTKGKRIKTIVVDKCTPSVIIASDQLNGYVLAIDHSRTFVLIPEESWPKFEGQVFAKAAPIPVPLEITAEGLASVNVKFGDVDRLGLLDVTSDLVLFPRSASSKLPSTEKHVAYVEFFGSPEPCFVADKFDRFEISPRLGFESIAMLIVNDRPEGVGGRLQALCGLDAFKNHMIAIDPAHKVLYVSP